MNHPNHTEIIYVGDPMCSWCWGFVPTLDRLVANSSETARLRIVVGGLRPGPHAQKMDANLKEYIRSHWRHVQQATGQPFDFDFFRRENFVYDTEPACQAVVAVRAVAPAREFLFFKALQQAFYAENVDITNEKSYTPFLKRFEIDEGRFCDRLHSEANRQATHRDFAESRSLGVRGFPSVILRKEDDLRLLTAGYQPYERLAPVLEDFFRTAA